MTLELKEVRASNERLKVEPLLSHNPGFAVLFHLGEHVQFGGLLLKDFCSIIWSFNKILVQVERFWYNLLLIYFDQTKKLVFQIISLS